jgi:hypothetical protein
MNLEALKEIIDGTIIEVNNPNNAFLAFVKKDKQCSISYEGQRETLAQCLFSCMVQYRDLADMVCAAYEAFQDYEENHEQ